jgi:hypothetical protein
MITDLLDILNALSRIPNISGEYNRCTQDIVRNVKHALLQGAIDFHRLHGEQRRAHMDRDGYKCIQLHVVKD